MKPDGAKDKTKQWLWYSQFYQCIINFILAIIHPELYYAGRHALDQLRLSESEVTLEWAKCWESVYTVTSVISYHTVPPHFDPQGNDKYYDVLTSFGSANVCIIFPQIKAEFLYGLGGTISFSGSLFEHAVPSWGNGARVSYALFMRPEVISNNFHCSVDWPTLS